jgi:hypothetical protein
MPVFPHGADPPPACVASAPAPSTSSAAVPPSSAVAAGSSSRPAPIEFSDSDDDSNGLSIHSSDSDVVEFVSITMRPQQRRPQQPSTSAASSFNASRVPVASSLGSTVASSCRVGSGSGKMGGRKKKGSDGAFNFGAVRCKFQSISHHLDHFSQMTTSLYLPIVTTNRRPTHRSPSFPLVRCIPRAASFW